jgi:aldehyde dehydrogenase (NAD+)
MTTLTVDRILVDGAWRTPNGSPINILSPVTEEPVLSLIDASAEDVDAAVAAARRAFESSSWRSLTPRERAAMLAPVAEELRKRWSTEIAPAFTAVCGTPITVANGFSGGASGIFADVARTVESYTTEEIVQGVGGRAAAGRPAKVVSEPVGVVAAIAPWNGQLYLTLTKLLPALVAGCTVVAKPSPETAVEAIVLAEALQAAGIPDGVVNILPGGREAGQRLVSHPDVDMVAFTGSTGAGKAIMAQVSDRLARLSLELGGKSAGIVLEDADTATVSRQLLSGTALMTGQACALLSRILVPRARHDELAEAFGAAIGAVPFGDPNDPATLMGPLVTKVGMNHALDLIDSAKAEGATLVRGGGRPDGFDRGWFVEPTVFAGVDNSMRLAREEVFGPVYAIVPYDTESEAIAIANDTPFGLAGAVFSADEARAEQVARQVRAGVMSINGFGLDPGIPFGGFKQSGIGREGGLEGLRMFTETKAIHRPTPAPGITGAATTHGES